MPHYTVVTRRTVTVTIYREEGASQDAVRERYQSEFEAFNAGPSASFDKTSIGVHVDERIELLEVTESDEELPLRSPDPRLQTPDSLERAS